MLFAVKNYFIPSLLLLAILGASAAWARAALGLDWRLEMGPGQMGNLLLGAGVMAFSDGVMHFGFKLALGERYLCRYRALVQYFRPQHAPQIFAGGLLAGGEELVFRGVLVEGLRSSAGMAAAAAVAVSAVTFGLLHTIPRRQLLPFGVWAVWEGTLLGCVYVLSGSLTVCVLVHVMHDITGFSLFAYQRRTGWLL